MRPHNASLIAAALILAAHSTVIGVTIDPVTTRSVRHTELDWHFVPHLGASQVKGYLAWREPQSLNGSNLGVLYLKRASNGTWQSVAWAGNNIGLAVLSIRATPGNEEAFSAEPDLMYRMHRACLGEDPVELIKGLLADDPFQPLIQSNPEAPSVIEALALLGWQVAPDLSPLMTGAPRMCNSVPLVPIDDFMNHLHSSTTHQMYGEVLDPDDCPQGRPWFCAGCTGTYGPTTGAGPWTLTIVAFGSYKRCIWTRSATMTYSETGQRMIGCGACAGPTTIQGCEIYEVRVPAGDSCPSAPNSGDQFIDADCGAIQW